MKANRKFTRGDDAVSPVIAVILMVAITVVLAATVYAWVSGFGGNNSQPSRSIALAGDAPIASDGIKTLTVTAATPSLHWSGFAISINGQLLEQAPTVDETEAALACTDAAAEGEFIVCEGADRKAAATLVRAGDTLRVSAQPGDVLRVVDTQANSVILTMMLG